MLSDESSSDSETGRFKCQSEKQSLHKNSIQKEDKSRYSGRSRPENDRFRKELHRKRDDRSRIRRHSRDRERIRYSRHSPNRRRYSRDRSPNRSLHDRHRRESRGKSRSRGPRSKSKEKLRCSKSKTHKIPSQKEEMKQSSANKEEHSDKQNKNTRETLSPDYKNKRSVIHKPPAKQEPLQKKTETPVIVVEHDSDNSVDVQPGSYYSMIPAVIKEKSEESSEIDSSDDERLRAKLLNLEKELRKTRKKKHKKKHKRRSSKCSKDRDLDNAASVEVSSTTDIDKVKTDISNNQVESAEVTSTQKSNQKESSEEGEISSDDDSQTSLNIDPSDLRHKLKKLNPKDGKTESQDLRERLKTDVCGPALPPHLQNKYRCSSSVEVEGPILPPHLKKQERAVGPSIPDNMRKTLTEAKHEIIKYESSDEDIGIGPLPVNAEDKWSDAHKRLEERALDMKIKKLQGHSLQSSDIKTREQWMLELPEAKAKYLGLEARTFRAKEGPDMSDRSSWTDTPEEKARKAAGIAKKEDAAENLKLEARARQITNRDDEQEKEAKKYKKKHRREESLLEMHEKKIKKKKKKEEKEPDKKERRVFSREIDLQVNRFDEAQKKSIIKKAQNLDSRFSRGEAKYL